MIGDLDSQVERNNGIEQRSLPSVDLGGVVNGRSSEAEASGDMGVVHEQRANGISSKGHDRTVSVSDSDLYGNDNMPHVSEDPNSVVGAVCADKDGHLVVKDRFWSVFCKEVSLKPAKYLPLLDQWDVTLAPLIKSN